MRKWLAGWISRIGGDLVRFANRLYGPPELQSVNERISDGIAEARSLVLEGRDGSRWKITGGGSIGMPPERRESRGWH